MFNFIKRSIKRNFGIDKEYYRFIDDMFGFIPNNIELYKVALIHKSASQSVGGHHINNERLEYLGDAVIESITSDYLFIAYPDRDEGFLTQMRSKIVSRQSLNEMAVFIGLDKYLICNSGATLQQKHLYGDAFEAMMGAIYLDQGYNFTNRLLINNIYGRFLSIDELSDSESDFKSRLIEWCQKNRHTLEFRTRKDTDRKTSAPVFFTTVLIDGIETGHGIGDSKKNSEQKAACSVTLEISDEACARVLDKVDKMMTRLETANAPKAENGEKSDNGEEQSGHKSEQKRRHGKKKRSATTEGAATENAADEASQSIAEEAKAPETVKTETVQEQPAAESEVQEPAQSKSRRGRRRKAETAAASAEEPSTETADGQPAKRGRGRRKKTESDTAQAAEAPTAQAETAAEPAKRRGRRKKTESTAASAEEQAAETVQTEQAPRKRRGRRKKAEDAPEAEVQSTAESVEQ